MYNLMKCEGEIHRFAATARKEFRFLTETKLKS